MNTQKTKNGLIPSVPVIKILGGLLLLLSFAFILSGCSASKLKIAEYDFVYNGTKYTLRSAYCPDNPNSCNSLIGQKFVAVDENLDGIIDKVIKGKIALSKAQEIYDYSLNMLKRQGGLKEIDKSSKEYTRKKSGYVFSIKSFFSEENPFNQFKIIDKTGLPGSYKESVYVDKGADGKLDEVLKGGFLRKTAQQMYAETISAGLKESKLIKKDGIILVK